MALVSRLNALFFLATAIIVLAAVSWSYPTVYPTGTTIYQPDKTWNGYTTFPTPGEKGVVDSSSVESDGFSLRVIKVYDGVNDNLITRLDVLFGWASPYPELACIYGS